jgi:uncharacterized membrane protein
LWFVPGLMAAAAITLAILMLRLDDVWAPQWAVESGWIYSRSSGGARDLLSTVATSMITVAGLTFSILVVALQLASSQFGPRVLRNYIRDRGSQVVLGTFIATFLYCIVVMRTIGDVDGDEPRLAVTVAVVLAIASLAVLIYFLHHSAASIHAPHVIKVAAGELTAAIERLYPEDLGQPVAALSRPVVPAQQAVVRTTRDGYIQRIDGDALLVVAVESDTGMELLRRPGDFVFAGQPVLAVWPRERCVPGVARAAAAAFIIGGHRTADQDVEFSFEQLVQISLRALSPAFNDPLTAAACVEHLGAAFHRLLRRRTPPSVRAGSDGRARLIAPPLSAARLLHLVWPPILDSARGSIIVTRQIGRTLAAIADGVQDDAARRSLGAIVRMLQQHLGSLSPEWQDEVRAECDRALERLTREGDGVGLSGFLER